jgi:hypothetical protein
VTVRDRIVQIVVRFEYVPHFCGEVGQQELLSNVDLASKWPLPTAAGRSQQIIQCLFSGKARCPFKTVTILLFVLPRSFGENPIAPYLLVYPDDER